MVQNTTITILIIQNSPLLGLTYFISLDKVFFLSTIHQSLKTHRTTIKALSLEFKMTISKVGYSLRHIYLLRPEEWLSVSYTDLRLSTGNSRFCVLTLE